MKKIYLILISMFLIAFAMGCLGGDADFEETKLDVEEGVGIIDTLKIDELRPGLSGYVSLTLRSNLEGIGSSDVEISLENVRPFAILECGEDYYDPNIIRMCPGQLELDTGLPVSKRGTERVFPGEELEVFWRIRAPGRDEISDIALRHPLYYNVEYSYSVNFRQNIIFMSHEEMLRRRERGEDYIMTGETGSTAGEIRFSGATRQPIYYSFDYRAFDNQDEKEFDFVLSYSIVNRGRGFPISDIVLIMTYPDDGITYNPELMREYGWEESLGNEKCHDGTEIITDCENWIRGIFEAEFIDGITGGDNVLYRIIDRERFMDEFSVHAPMQISSEEMTQLRNRNVPLRIYSFNVYAAYRYYIEGKEYINVYPLRGI